MYKLIVIGSERSPIIVVSFSFEDLIVTYNKIRGIHRKRSSLSGCLFLINIFKSYFITSEVDKLELFSIDDIFAIRIETAAHVVAL